MLCPIKCNPHNIFDIRTVHNIFRWVSYQIFRLLFALEEIRRVTVIGRTVSVLAIRESVVSHIQSAVNKTSQTGLDYW